MPKETMTDFEKQIHYFNQLTLAQVRRAQRKLQNQLGAAMVLNNALDDLKELKRRETESTTAR